jgi:type IV secretory pathway TraG/TraD family ATPase VirD4
VSHKPSPYSWRLDARLMSWTEADAFTIGHSFEGMSVFGATGSGKSSGVGANVALSMLRAGYSFLVTATKPTDVAEWEQLAERSGRTGDLVIVQPDGTHRVNVLDYSYKAAGRKAANADNLTGLVMRMLSVRDRNRGQPSEPFWVDSAKMAFTNSLDLLAAAGEVISFPNITRILSSLPDTPEQARDPVWQKESFVNAVVDKAVARRDLTTAQQNDLGVALEWALSAWPRIYERTRSGIRSTLDSLIFPWARSPLATLFGSDTTFTPESCFERGSIVVLALDVKTYLEAGQLAQILLKTIWQQALERRDTAKFPRPVCLWMDEFQNFVTDYDPLFQATARSSQTAVVVMTQNFPSLVSRFPGPMGKSEAQALLGNFGTKIFCSNDDHDTNELASKMIGEVWTKQSNVTAGLGEDGNMSAATSDQRRRRVEPVAFVQLKKGGMESGKVVEAYCFRSGRPFKASGMNHVKVAFSQNPN